MNLAPSRRATLILLLLAGMACASLLIAAVLGSVPIALSDLAPALLELQHSTHHSMAATLLDLRLQRGLVAFVTGAGLSLAGMMMQALLRNPLADPYVLGISAGSAVGALGAMLLMCASWMVDAAALAGAITISMLLYLLARRDLRHGSSAEGGSSQLLLTGVILSSGSMAIVTLILSLAPEGRLRGMMFWMIGDVAGAPLRLFPWIALAIALLFALRHARALNLLALHAQNAVTLGVAVAQVRQGLFLCSAMLTASAVTTTGSIGFVGLIVPHACRFAFGPDHRILIPASCLAGGGFLVLADTLARTIAAPQQLPVGVITALIGTPIFLFQLHHLRRA